MHPLRSASLFAATFLAPLAFASEKLTVTVTHDLAIARPAETIVVPFEEVRQAFGADTPMHHVLVRDAAGNPVPAQVTNFRPNLRPGVYDELLFQHDFAAGEKSVTFTIERTEAPVPPTASKVFARYVPERHDDFAWENDRIAHRIYGPELNTAAAGKSQLRTSGLDVWAKRVRYPIVDRWYSKGHDAYHVDTGEGLDLYSVGPGRGAGGTGVWDGSTLHTSDNWASVKVLANGPIRAVFEVSYAPWSAGEGVTVAETKRFTVDAGHNLDRIESTFQVQGAEEVTVALGIVNPPDATAEGGLQDAAAAVLSLWQTYEKHGSLGVGVVLEPGAACAGFAEGASADDRRNKKPLCNRLMLVKVKDGDTVAYRAGAGWTRSGDFADRAAWEQYLLALSQRLASPVQITVSK